ncbi:PstS family phosphate ABC transporter substrate-binding protein [Cellulosimicrobium funkei]|uniref:Phosphate-binding protein n=1 Tax=Cellulosimicrobium funkei TaxID=264251 RepID=A0A4Y8QYW3_9MICO|nr:PstS family phosphate ABC transporter substrate-binding protein [Cellulosimicrobium funkei]TFF04428.1 PstS family phosphate ABC transporter substrate-binding protein [Cellulosimicrobium funkei]TGA67907.1 PstS family phosphate ABC transporter substrate-binding protein [Cellulosimicrobium terreum]
MTYVFRLPQRSAVVIGATGLVLTLAACGGQSQGATGDGGESGGLSGEVVIDGSSTVEPLSSAAATLFRDEEPGINVTVATSGTGGGFERFCAGETDISDASRPIKDEEIAACEDNGVEFTEIVIANDGLSVVVNPENDWLECITTDQLATIWGPESEGTVTSWSQVDPEFPDETLELYGAGTDSGTFDYFTEAINGEEGAIRTDYTPSEDDNLTVQGVSGAVGAMGFFGLSYAEENADSVKLLAVDNGDGCVTPSKETVQDGTYSPLGRPLFIYVNNAKYAENEALRSFVDFYLANEEEIAADALFIDLTDEQQQTAADELASLVG